MPCKEFNTDKTADIACGLVLIRYNSITFPLFS